MQVHLVQLTPTPGYVLKTRELAGSTPGAKVFLNVCHAPQVPAPEADFDPTVLFGLIVDNKWEIPIFVSPPKAVADKKGARATCYDCCVNARCFDWLTVNADLRSIVNEWSIEAVEFMYSTALDRAYTVPKMLCKGELLRPVVDSLELTQSALQKRFEEITQNEALALVDSVDGPSDTEVSLFGPTSQKKPLIEELDEPAASKSSAKTTGGTPEETGKSAPDTPYEVSVSKTSSQPQSHSLVVRFRCDTDPKSLSVACDTQNVALVFRSSSTTLGGRPAVTLPLPTHVSTAEIAAFYVAPEATLYVFV